MKTTKPLSAGFSEIEPSSFGIGAVLLCLNSRAVSMSPLVSVWSSEIGSIFPPLLRQVSLLE